MTSLAPAIHNIKNKLIIGILLVIIDLDRTLFDTTTFYEDCLEWVRFTRGLGPAAEQAARLAERKGEFDIFEFLAHTYGFPKEAAADGIRIYIKRKYAGNPRHSYLLPGAASLVNYLRRHKLAFPVIITTGKVFNQEFKLSFCRELNGVPYEIIDGNKGTRIKNDLKRFGAVLFRDKLYPHFVLVDDKACNILEITIHMLSSEFTRLLFHVIRKDGKDATPTNMDHITTVYELNDVKKHLTHALSRL